MTGLGLLCFLGHGETTTSPEFGKTVEKAVSWIIKTGTEQQGHLNRGTTFNQPGVYEHAIAAYGLTGQSRDVDGRLDCAKRIAAAERGT